MAFPTEVQAEAFANLEAVRTHVGIAAASLKAVFARTGSPGNIIANLALLDAPVIRAAVAAARVGDDPAAEVPLSPMEAAQAGLVWRIARRLTFTRAGGSWADWPDVNPLDPSIGLTGTALSPPGQLAPPAVQQGAVVATTGQRTVKLSAVLDQGDATEVVLAVQAELTKWHTNYHTAMGEAPPDQSEPTLEQLSALDNRIRVQGLSPYADFAVFVPYGRRGLRAMRFRSWTPVGDGSYTCKEVPGPENWLQWEAAFDLFSVAMVMLSHVNQATLASYKTTIKNLVLLWPDCWHLVCLADDKMRAEQWSRIKRHIDNDIAAGGTPPTGYTQAAPWSAVIRRSCVDNDFWNEQVRYPAAAWVARGARGVQLAPEERLASTLLPGGSAALVPEWEAMEDNASGTRKRRRTKNGSGGPPLHHNAEGMPLLALEDTSGRQGVWGNSSSKGTPKGKGGKGGKTLRGSPAGGDKKGDKERIETDTCLNWDLQRGTGPCTSAKPGTPCTMGRKHVCRTCGRDHRTVDHDKFQ